MDDERDGPRRPFLISPQLERYGDQLWTDPMTVREWTEAYFPRLSTKTVRKLLRKMAETGRTWQLDSMWRIRLLDAPDGYLKQKGFIASALTRKESVEIVDLIETLRIARYGHEASGSYEAPRAEEDAA